MLAVRGAARRPEPWRVARRGFRALVANSSKESDPPSKLLEFSSTSELPRQDPSADVEVSVTHSTMNYKDAMIVLGQRGVVKQFPIVGGIDFAGVVRGRPSKKVFPTTRCRTVHRAAVRTRAKSCGPEQPCAGLTVSGGTLVFGALEGG